MRPLLSFLINLQVRSYTFSPDSGKIDCIRYDALGWPAIPEKLVGVWEVGVECIQEIDGFARITLLPGAESNLSRISDGPLELAFVALQVGLSSSMHIDSVQTLLPFLLGNHGYVLGNLIQYSLMAMN